MGGEGKTVQIDEAKFGNREYHRGRMITGNWVFGGIQEDTKEMFLVAVPDRKRETLV